MVYLDSTSAILVLRRCDIGTQSPDCRCASRLYVIYLKTGCQSSNDSGSSRPFFAPIGPPRRGIHHCWSSPHYGDFGPARPRVPRRDSTEPLSPMNETDLPCSDCGSALTERTIPSTELPHLTASADTIEIARCQACGARYYPERTLAMLVRPTNGDQLRGGR